MTDDGDTADTPAERLVNRLRPDSVWDDDAGWYKDETDYDWSDAPINADEAEPGEIPEPCLDGAHGEVRAVEATTGQGTVIIERADTKQIERFLDTHDIEVPGGDYTIDELKSGGVAINLGA